MKKLIILSCVSLGSLIYDARATCSLSSCSTALKADVLSAYNSGKKAFDDLKELKAEAESSPSSLKGTSKATISGTHQTINNSYNSLVSAYNTAKGSCLTEIGACKAEVEAWYDYAKSWATWIWSKI